MADLRETCASATCGKASRHHPALRRRSVGAVVVLGVLLILLLMPGSALAQPGGANQSWYYVGSTPGWKTAFGFTYNDPESPLKVMDFQVDAPTPGAYIFSGITLAVNGTAIPNACTQPTAVTQPTIACNFTSGAVSNGATVKLVFDSGSTIPKNNGGYVFLEDFANKTMSNTVQGPLLATGKVGKPFITNASLTGLKTHHPHFAFKLHQGMNAPEINSFTLNFLRGGLTIGTNEPPTLTERWNGHRWSCTHKTKRELDCDTPKPINTAHIIIAYPLLHESSGLEKRKKGTYKAELKVNGKVVGTVNVPIE